MRILIAPNAFKNSLSAQNATEAIRQGLLQSGLHCSLDCFPIGDGGDGTGELIIHYMNGKSVETLANDPLGRETKSYIGFLEEGKTAVIEMAGISGLKLLQEYELDPLHASSYGTGQLMQFALDNGARTIILCLGGSATVDGGCGILRAMGIRFLDKTKKELVDLPEHLVYLNSIDVSGIDQRISETAIIVLCDVHNMLLGANGASAIFGPQKGASAADIRHLEIALGKLREVALSQTGKDMNMIRYGGAAGGTAAGLYVFLNAKIVEGIEYFLDLTAFNAALEKADLLITGEGSIDLQTLNGKGPYGVARRAKQKEIPVIGVAGAVPLVDNYGLNACFDILLAIGHEPENQTTAVLHTYKNLERTAKQIGKLLAFSNI